METYTVEYDLNGGIGAASNPETYTSADSFTLAAPVRYGYEFDGWEGTGIDGSTKELTVAKGSSGNRSYKATWKVFNAEAAQNSLLQYAGMDDGIADSGSAALSTTGLTGSRGEAVYTLKTVFTDIKTDGTRDNAYSYGVHLKSDQNDNASVWSLKKSSFEVWMIADYLGKVHIFAEISDSDIVSNAELWAYKWWHTDSFQMYLDPGNTGSNGNPMTFGADSSFNKYTPSEYRTVKTDKGFNVEFVLDNDGKGFCDGDEFGYGFFYNECCNYTNTSSYKKCTLKTSCRLAQSAYAAPDPQKQDAVRISCESATGSVNSTAVSYGATGNMLSDIMSGKGSTCIVFADDAQGTAYNAATEISEYIRKISGKSVRLSSCAKKPSGCDYYIYFGKSDSELCTELEDRLGYGEYGVFVYSSAIVCSGWLASGINSAKNTLFAVLDTGAAGRNIPASGTLYKAALSGSILARVPETVSGWDFISESEEGSAQLVKKEDDGTAFEAWKSAFEAAGYEKYTEHVMNTVKCVTYVNSAAVVNINYCEADKTLRAVVENRDDTTLPERELQNPSNGLCSVTQVGECNMCYIIKLSDGTFVIIDSGNNGTQNYIRQKLYELAGSTLVTVTAWIFTHFHQDHVGGFIDFVSSGYASGIKIKNVIYSFPDYQVLYTASATDQKNMSAWQTTLINSGAAVSKARTGQVYNFCGCTVEILFTYDDLMPYRILKDGDDSNTTSMIFRVDICGQTLLFPGDASGVGTKCAATRLKSYLKSDFVQLCHHGYGSGGTFRNFYAYAKATYVLLPGTGTSLGDSEKYAISMAKKTFIRGSTSQTIALPCSD